MKTMKTMKIGEFEELVMLAVARAEHYGEAATSRIQEVLQREAERDASLGAIYAALDRLERKGCVVSRLARPAVDGDRGRGGRRSRGAAPADADQERSRRVRRVYRVTEQGRVALGAARKTRERLREGIEQVLGRGGTDSRGAVNG